MVKLNFSGQDQCGSYKIVYSGCSLFITGNCSHLWVVYPVFHLVFAGIQDDSRGQMKDSVTIAKVKKTEEQMKAEMPDFLTDRFFSLVSPESRFLCQYSKAELKNNNNNNNRFIGPSALR